VVRETLPTAKSRPAEGNDAAGGMFLLVVGRDAYATYDLPASGALTIGRGESNSVRVDDPLASRNHACLHVGESMFLEDVGSVNGTRVKDRAVTPRERVRITIGETIQIGSSVLIVQRRAAQADLIRPETLRDEGMPITLAAPSIPRAGEAMRRVHELAERAAAGTINVLIAGETGVGKELLAATVHRASPRRGGPYVCLNCAALSETLLESELFGHERGAFTGAVQAKLGLLETAARGTLFLDEVGELPLATQAKLLRVIETHEVMRVGAVKPRTVDVRFLAATNRVLEDEVARGAFRQDLYYRLNGISLLIPPLRARADEIEPLARSFAEAAARIGERAAPTLSAAALKLLLGYPWPGNIRELRNTIERALLISTGDSITPEDLPLEKMRGTPISMARVPEAAPRTAQVFPVTSLDEDSRLDYERIIESLSLCSGNQTRAAKLLGMSRRTFCARLKAYNIPRPRVGNS